MPTQVIAPRERLAELFRVRPDLTHADIAAYTTLGLSTIKKYSSGAQPPTERIDAEITRVLDHIQSGDICKPGGDSVLAIGEAQPERVRRVACRHGFYQTEFVKRCAQVMDYCAENAAIGLITGDFGSGKTEAVGAWRRSEGRSIDSIVIEFDEFTGASRIAIIQAVAEALGLPTVCAANDGARLFRDVCKALQARPCLLIFDQCELARPRILQVLRQVWDRTRDAGVGVVLLAAPILLVRLKASRMQDLGALESRIGVVAPLAGVSRQEMAAVVKQEGIADVTDEAFQLWFRACRGSMRRLMASLDLLKSKHAGKQISEKTISQVAGHLWGMQIHPETI
jgi:DNA transposition AAA+ family ATPase